MSLFWIPKGVKFRLEKIQQDFLWGGGNLERKIHLVNWSIVCTSKERGGLGVQSLVKLDMSLLGKMELETCCGGQSPLERSD